MLFPSQKPSSSYSLLKFFTSSISQWCTPSQEKSWIRPCNLPDGHSEVLGGIQITEKKCFFGLVKMLVQVHASYSLPD